MKRKATIIRKSDDGRRCIAVDDELWADLLIFINGDRAISKKFDLITELLLAGIRNTDLYDKEEIDEKSKGVRAMKFKSGKNARVYCREVTTNNKTFIIKACELHESKKNMKNLHKEKTIIHRIAKYEYYEIN